MTNAEWWAVVTFLLILLIFALRPLLAWLASWLHWKRTHKRAGNGQTPPQP